MPDTIAPTRPRLALVCACNDADVLARNLMASSMVDRMDEVLIRHDEPSAARAFNSALEEVRADVVIFAHQDVYFPPRWLDQLYTALDQLAEADPNWAILAPFGMVGGQHFGGVYSTSQSAIVGDPLTGLTRTSSVDELVIILRRASGLAFDDALPDWHMYGTDIVQTALDRGFGAWIAPMPVVHNDKFHDHLGAGFGKAYRAFWWKWRRKLPLRTSILWVSWHRLDLLIYRLRAYRSLEKRQQRAGDTGTDPKEYSHACGWEAD